MPKYAEVGNYGEAKIKSCIQDVARVYGVPLDETFLVTKMLPIEIEEIKIEEYSLEDLKNRFKYLQDYLNKYPNVEKCVSILMGRKRVMGHHASGVVILDRDIDECLPVYMRDGVKLTVWIEGEDDRELANNGIFKFDILGSKNLSIMVDTINLVNKRHNSGITVKNIPVEDEKAMELIRKGDTSFIFQLESGLGQSTCMKIEPTKFSDVVMISGLVRPGPIKANVPQQISDRKKGVSEFFIPEPLEEVLGETFGKVLYQESLLKVSQIIGGFTEKEANKLRKVLVKAKNKKIQEEEIPKYRKIWDANALPKVRPYFLEEFDAITYIEELWKEMESMAVYSFNCAHATSYTLLTCREAYLKAHYFPEFMSVALSYEPSDNLKRYIIDLKSKNIEFRYPDINLSTNMFEIDKDGNFIYPLSHIKNITDDVADEIISHRPYTSLDDFISKIDKTKVNKKKVESLILAGCFDLMYSGELGLDRNGIINHYYTNIRKEKNYEQVKYKNSELNAFEDELIGLSLSKKTLYDKTKDAIKKLGGNIKYPVELSSKMNDLSAMKFPLFVVGKVKKCERKKGKSGKEYDMITLTDDVNTISIFKFGKPSGIESGGIYILNVNKFKDSNSLLVEYGKDCITKL